MLRDEPDREHGAQLPDPMRALHGLEVGLRVPIQLEEDYLRQRGRTGLERVWERLGDLLRSAKGMQKV